MPVVNALVQLLLMTPRQGWVVSGGVGGRNRERVTASNPEGESEATEGRGALVKVGNGVQGRGG